MVDPEEARGCAPEGVKQGWWEELFACHPSRSESRGHRCGEHQMLTLVAYDIADPKRLHRVAKVCENWGIRIQYSVFECRLDAECFDRFWADLLAEMDLTVDRAVAYKVCLRCAREIRDAGPMIHSEKVVAYVV